MALALVLAQLRAQMALPRYASEPSLGVLYLTDHHAAEAREILDAISAELSGVTDWVGGVGIGVCASGAEYFNEPALSVMLCDLTPDQYQVFSGVSPLRSRPLGDGRVFEPQTALVHADPGTPELAELVAELADRMSSGQLFGGLVSSRGAHVQLASSSDGNLKGHGAASGVFTGGLSGVAFGPEVHIVSRVTQGAQPIGPERMVTSSDGNLVLGLDEQPAFDLLLEEASIDLEQPQQAMSKLRSTLVGLTFPDAQGVPDDERREVDRVRHVFGDDVQVRHIIGVDPGRRGVAVAATVPEGTRLAFCERHAQAAKADLMRICAEIREELEPQVVSHDVAMEMADSDVEALGHPSRRIRGAIFVSCTGRGGPHFGAPSAELQIVRQALGEVPLVGFFAGGEIAHQRIHGYSGVLTVFVGH